MACGLHRVCDDGVVGAFGEGDDVALVLGGDGERCGEEDECAGGELHFVFGWVGGVGGGREGGSGRGSERERDRQTMRAACVCLAVRSSCSLSAGMPMIVLLETSSQRNVVYYSMYKTTCTCTF